LENVNKFVEKKCRIKTENQGRGFNINVEMEIMNAWKEVRRKRKIRNPKQAQNPNNQNSK